MIHVMSDIQQGSEEWHTARRGIVTASTVHGLITPKTVQVAANPESRALTALLAAEDITGWTDDTYVSFDMARGHEIEPIARTIYSTNYAPVTEVGFIVRDDWGFKIGYSPDGLVGEDGLIEIKSHRPKEHLATVLANEIPAENMAQCQAGMLISGRKWIDYISYCGGMALWIKRVLPDATWQTAIVDAVTALEEAKADMIARYNAATDDLPMTERTPEFEEMRF